VFEKFVYQITDENCVFGFSVGGTCGANKGEQDAHRLLVGKPEGKRPLGRPRRRWVDNIKIDVVEVEWEYVD
jgi:hypothetical protein